MVSSICLFVNRSCAMQPDAQRSVERPPQMQFIQKPHQPQIPLRRARCDVIDVRAAQIEQLCLALPGYLAIPLNHRFPLRPGNFPSAPSKKEFSIVSSPIFACSSRIRSLPSEASTSPPKIAARSQAARSSRPSPGSHEPRGGPRSAPPSSHPGSPPGLLAP